MTNKNSNGIISSLALISESFRAIDFSEDEFITYIDSSLFLHIFDDIVDFRQKSKVEYKLSNLLMLIFLVILQYGKQSYVAIADFIEVGQKKYRQYNLLGDTCPSHDTIRRVLTLLSGDSLQENTLQGFYNFLKYLEKHALKQGDYTHLGIDGKEIRGSGRSKNTKNPLRNTATLNVYDSSLGTCIACTPIDKKENEIPVAQRIIKEMYLKNTVVTADALHCQKETAKIIQEQKGIYILSVKDNQRSLLQEMDFKFNSPKTKIHTYNCDGRKIEIINLPKSYAITSEWKGLRSFVKMISTKRKNECIRYFITNTDDERLIIEGIEKRWLIENDLHRQKDIDFGEDSIRSTDKNALHNIAILNNLGLQLMRIYQALSLKPFIKAKRGMQADSIECMNYILGIMSSQEIISKLIDELHKQKKKR